ncbi:hypothetical protein Tco_0162703, partial [Tanacetum coccineum]
SAAENTDTSLRNYEKILLKFKTRHVKGLNKIRTNLLNVQDTFKDDPVLNSKVPKATNVYIQNSAKLTKLNLHMENPDAPMLIEFEIDGKMIKIPHDQLQDHLDKNEQMNKAMKEAKLRKLVIIKVAAEVVNEVEVQIKGSKEFLKLQDAYLQDLTRAHNEKL